MPPPAAAPWTRRMMTAFSAFTWGEYPLMYWRIFPRIFAPNIPRMFGRIFWRIFVTNTRL